MIRPSTVACCVDVTGIDYLNYPIPRAARFHVVYTLRNWQDNLLVQVRTAGARPAAGHYHRQPICGVQQTGESVRSTINTASRFKGHPDLRRILNHWQFQGHPLRKDYPIEQGQICYETDSLEKEIRTRLR